MTKEELKKEVNVAKKAIKDLASSDLNTITEAFLELKNALLDKEECLSNIESKLNDLFNSQKIKSYVNASKYLKTSFDELSNLYKSNSSKSAKKW